MRGLKKALIISVGTGTGSDGRLKLAEALTLCIQTHNPTKTFFIVSRESSETLQLILPKITSEHETIEVSEPDDVRRIYDELRPKFSEICHQFERVTVDYTSGTKSMTAALAILGVFFEVTLSNISGSRKNGIVVKGTEVMRTVRPIAMVCEKRITEATKFFNECRFNTTLFIINSIREMTADETILENIVTLHKAALAYSAWDKFDHNTAFENLKPLKAAEFNLNKRFLGELLTRNEKEPYWIADLINNAKRRGDIEHKFDDAVARLYRTVELIAQYRLRKEHKLEPSSLDVGRVPSDLRERWGIMKVNEKIKLGLERDYELLTAFGDDVGKRFIADKEFRGLLSKRNNSILAHGLEPLDKEVYERLLGKTLDIADYFIPDLKQNLQDSCFVRVPI